MTCFFFSRKIGRSGCASISLSLDVSFGYFLDVFCVCDHGSVLGNVQIRYIYIYWMCCFVVLMCLCVCVVGFTATGCPFKNLKQYMCFSGLLGKLESMLPR